MLPSSRLAMLCLASAALPLRFGPAAELWFGQRLEVARLTAMLARHLRLSELRDWTGRKARGKMMDDSLVSSGQSQRYAVECSQMFDGIDDIDWSTLTHAYGAATDVPGLLRSLASTDEKTRENAIYELFGNIWHQGTVYEATIYAVPFLVELLASPHTEDKSAIACLLASIADGYGYLEVHAQPDSFESDWRSILSKQGKDLETEMANELATTNRVREAVKIALPFIAPFLSDTDPETRSCVALAISRFPELSDANLPLLLNALSSETDSETRDAIQEAIGRLKTQGTA